MKDMANAEKLFAEAYIRNNANGTEAARSISTTENKASLGRLATRYLQRPGVKEILKGAIEEMGFDRKKVLGRLSKRLNSLIDDGKVQEIVALTRTSDGLARKAEENASEQWNRKVKMITETDFAVSQLNIGEPEPFEKLFGVTLFFEKKKKAEESKELLPYSAS